MIPVLFNENETIFTTQGLGALSDAISCTVTEERNGIYELEMTYPISGIHYSDIQYRSIIAAIPSPYRDRQPFRVYKITKPLNGIVTIYARHLSYDLNAIPVNPFSTTGITNAFTALKNSMTIENNFVFSSGLTNETSQVSFTIPYACRTILGGVQGSFLDIFGGEYEWDNWNVKLWADRGKDNGVTIRYGKNMTDLSAEIDGENVVNGIYPYWQKDDVLVTCTPPVIWAENKPHDKAVTVDFSNDFEEQPTAAQLQERAEKYLNDNDVGEIKASIDVSFVDLSKMDDYKGFISNLEKCDLCDIVTVQYEALGVDIKSKIVSIVTDVLKEVYESIEVGAVSADIAQEIADTENKVDNVIRPDGSLIAEALRGFINGSLVNLYAQYDAAKPAGAEAILFECNDPANPLYGAMAMGTQGLMISRKKKDDGTGWDWTTAITSEGMMAGIIVAGILTDKTGKNSWNLDAGELVTKQGTVGGWVISAQNLTSPSGSMIFDSSVGKISTVRQNGNKGVEFIDDGLNFYSWRDNGDFVGELATGEFSDGTHVIWFNQHPGNMLYFGDADQRIQITDHDGESYNKGVTIHGPLRIKGIISFGNDVTNTDNQLYIGDNQMVIKSPSLFLPQNTIVGGRGVIGNTSTGNNKVNLGWDTKGLGLWVDNQFIGYFQMK